RATGPAPRNRGVRRGEDGDRGSALHTPCTAVPCPDECATLGAHGGLASTGKAVDLKSTGPRGPCRFESCALRHYRLRAAEPAAPGNRMVNVAPHPGALATETLPPSR